MADRDVSMRIGVETSLPTIVMAPGDLVSPAFSDCPVDVERPYVGGLPCLTASFEGLTAGLESARDSLWNLMSEWMSSDMSSTPDAPLYDYPPPLHFGRKPMKPGELGYHPHPLLGWMDEIWEFTRAIPEPVRGGTFFYCPWQKKIPHGLESCGIGHVGWATGTRFRTAKAYRRHYRRCHQS
jgi:hypothetical protein